MTLGWEFGDVGVIPPDLCDTGRSIGSLLGVGSFFSEMRVSKLKNSSTL